MTTQLHFGWTPTPGESVPYWEIVLDEDSEWKLSIADPDFDDFQPDVGNAKAALEWVDSLPDCRSITREQIEAAICQREEVKP